MRIIIYVCAASLVACLLLTVASLAFLYSYGLWGHPQIAAWEYPWQWLRYWNYEPRPRKTTLHLMLGAAISLGLVGAPAASLVRWHWNRVGGLQGMARRAVGKAKLKRGASLNHGDADWMTMADAQALFPSTPDPEIGGVVVGEASRVDLTPLARVPYDPKRPETWGPGGKAPLLIDHCTRGSTHSIVFGGSGLGNKTTSLATTLLVWRSSAVIFDPACELADMLQYGIESTGRRVVRLAIGGDGINVLSHLDGNDPLMPTTLGGIVSSIIGPTPDGGSGDGNHARFKGWGRDIVTCLLAHIVASTEPGSEERSLHVMRYALTEGGMQGLQGRLADIHDASPSEYARGIAGSFANWAEETFAGAYANAVGDTEWLEHGPLADLVAGEGFDPTDLLDGKTVVFVQVRRDILAERPAVGRVLIGALLQAVFAAEGRVAKRVGFFLDESALLGPMPILKTVRDLGRKYKITMQLIYQSEQQLVEIWGTGWEAWLDGVSWCSYGTVQSPATAERLSKRLGQFGAEAISVGQNAGSSSRMTEIMGTNSKGSNQSWHEISRPLLYQHELTQDVRTDERITLIPGRRPLRHGAAIGFRRPEIDALLSATSFTVQSLETQNA